jgi:P pilus assembly chaperone PapD
MTRIYAHAYEGNMRAAKIFLDATGGSSNQITVNNQQNNYIQVNGLTITQDFIKNLSADKLQRLQELIV